jgi:hypothetical protein
VITSLATTMVLVASTLMEAAAETMETSMTCTSTCPIVGAKRPVRSTVSAKALSIAGDRTMRMNSASYGRQSRVASNPSPI